jgi:hypothetical protein
MSDQSADAFMEWTAGIRKMLIEAGDKSAAALVDNYSFETFDAGWQASRRAALEEAAAEITKGISQVKENGWTDCANERLRCADAIRALAGATE